MDELDKKTCETCIWWKRYMLRSNPNTIYASKEFPCREPDFIREKTFGEQEEQEMKTKDDSCEKWKYER